MLVTTNRTWADRARVMRLHGIAQDSWNRYSERGSWHYDVVAPGFKYNMTDMAAALGLVQLTRLDEMNGRREHIAATYTAALRHPALQLPRPRPGARVSWHLFLLRLNLGLVRLTRAEFIQELKVRSIGTSVHFMPLHRHPYYRDQLGYQPEMFPVADREFERVISLPIYSLMTDRDAADVVAAVLDITSDRGGRH